MPQAILTINSNNVENFAGGLSIANLYIVANNPIFAASTVTITAGAGSNTVAVPSGATWVVIVPASTNTQALTLSGGSGGTPIAMSPNQPSVIALAGTGNIYIANAGGTASSLSVAFT